MARIKKNEKYVKNAAESLAKMVTDSASYQLFIEQLKLLFEGNEITLEGKEEIKRNIIKTFDKKNFGYDMKELDLYFENLKTVNNQDSILMANEELKGIKKYITKKKAVASTLIIAGFAVALTSCVKNNLTSSKKAAKTSTKVTKEVDVLTPASINIKNDEVNPLLNFNPEDKEIMKSKIVSFIKDSLPKGYKIKKSELATEIEDLVNFYIVLNMDNISSDMLLKLYQSDNIDVNKLYDSTFRVLAKLDKDAQVSKDIINISPLISDSISALNFSACSLVRFQITNFSISKISLIASVFLCACIPAP